MDHNSYLVRVMEGEAAYDQMIVVTELDSGRVLYLSGWRGPPLTAQQWRHAKALLFPDAEEVWFQRWKRGSYKLVKLRVS